METKLDGAVTENWEENWGENLEETRGKTEGKQRGNAALAAVLMRSFGHVYGIV